MSEIHLFIIWSNADNWKEKIIQDMKNKFCILGIHKMSWNKEHFSDNLTRFYGENLPKNSNKEKLCGNAPFTLIVVKDDAPLYRSRMTSKGVKEVNVNIFDSKEMYRNWTGGGHMIHGTNDKKEVRHDLVLLTGHSIQDYVKRYEANGKMLTEEYDSMPGEKKWDNMAQLLYVLNETIDYVVLRNFEGLFSEYGRTIHGDVDILTSEVYTAKLILNAKPVHKSKYRVQHIVKIGEGGTYFDIRAIGDDYYCKQFEVDILKSRYLHKDGYYRANEIYYIFPLLYHALVQKKKISQDYMQIFDKNFKDIKDKTNKRETLILILNNFMKEHQYQYVEPKDYSVYFNEEIVHQRMSIRKFGLKAFHKVFR